MKVKIKRLHKDAVTPFYAKPGDAGMDLTAVSRHYSTDNKKVRYETGLSMEIPHGCVGMIFPRSSVQNTNLRLSNSVGVIDSGYRGEISAIFDVLDPISPIVYDVGDRIAQIVIMPLPAVNFVEADELSETERGTGGFGHTGK